MNPLPAKLLSPLLLRAGLRYQLRHRWQLLLALIGIVMGVAVVLAVDLANQAAKASFALSAQALSGAASHQIIGVDRRVPDQVFRDLVTRPGHPPLAPVIEARVRLGDDTRPLRLVGLDLFSETGFRDRLPSLVQDTTTLGDWLSRPGLVALSASAAAHLGVGVGDRFHIEFEGRPQQLRAFVVGDDDSLASRDLLIVDIATAQAITGLKGFISRIDAVLDEASANRFRAELPPGLRLVEIDDQLSETAGLSSAFELNLTAMSLLALLVGVFLIFNAISFSIVQRRKLFGRLRAIGVRDGEISRLVLLEAAVLALVGTLIGTLIGYWLGQGLTRIVAATVSELYYQVSADAAQLNPASLLKAWILGLGGTALAAWLPARQAARTPPLTTLSRAALERDTRSRIPALAWSGIALVGLGLATATALPGGVVTGFAGLFVLLVGAALITPAAVRLAHHGLDRLSPGGVWRLAVRDLDRHLSRLSTATAALMVALAASVGVAVMVDSMRGAVSDWLEDLLRADLYVAAPGFEDGASLPAPVVAEARELSRARALSSYRNVELPHDGAPLRLIAAELAPASRGGFEFIAADGATPWDAFDRGAILVSEPLAHRLALRPGDQLPLLTDTGERAFRVAAVFRDFASEHGRLFIAREHYRRYWDDAKVDTLALFATANDPGTLLDEATDRLMAGHELVFTPPAGIYSESMAVFDRTFRITEVLRLLSLVVAFVGVLSALMALQLERRKEYAILRALGLTRSQISGLIVIESCLLGLIAALLAIPVGLAMAWILTAEIQLRAFGWSMPLTLGQEPLLITLITGLLAALLASLYPAWHSAGQQPATQLRED